MAIILQKFKNNYAFEFAVLKNEKNESGVFFCNKVKKFILVAPSIFTSNC